MWCFRRHHHPHPAHHRTVVPAASRAARRPSPPYRARRLAWNACRASPLRACRLARPRPEPPQARPHPARTRARAWRDWRGWCFRHVQVVRYSGKTSAARPELASPREDDDEGNGTRSSPPARGRGGSCSIHGPQSRQLAPRRPMTEAARLSGNGRPLACRAQHTYTARPGGDRGGFHPSSDVSEVCACPSAGAGGCREMCVPPPAAPLPPLPTVRVATAVAASHAAHAAAAASAIAAGVAKCCFRPLPLPLRPLLPLLPLLLMLPPLPLLPLLPRCRSRHHTCCHCRSPPLLRPIMPPCREPALAQRALAAQAAPAAAAAGG